MSEEKQGAFGYIRTGAMASLETLARQQHEILAFCIAERLELKVIFFDNGASSNNLNRPGWKSMVKCLKEDRGRIGRIVVSGMDRISRDFFLFRMAERTVEKYGAKICSCHQSDLSVFRQIIKTPKGKRSNRSLLRNR